MKVDKATSAVIVALVTGMCGLGTALVNRYTPNEAAVHESEKKGKRSYEAIRGALENVSEDVDDNAKRIDILEHTIALQNRTIQFLMSDVGVQNPTSDPPPIPTDPKGHAVKRTPTRMRGVIPSYDVTQSAGGN